MTNGPELLETLRRIEAELKELRADIRRVMQEHEMIPRKVEPPYIENTQRRRSFDGRS